MSNPAYGAMPMFERPRSAGSGMGGGGFIPPPPGASQGGEPGHYAPFQQPHMSPYNWNTPNSAHPQQHNPGWAYNQTQYHQPQSQPQFQPQLHQVSTPRWPYGQYPPSLQEPVSAPPATSAFPLTPVTPNAVSHYSPYPARHQPPPPTSAPAQFAPWSQDHQPQSQHSLPPVPYSEERFTHAVPKPFGGSANAPPPKKSAMKRSRSQSAGERPPGFQAPSMQRTTSTGSNSGSGGSGWPAGTQAVPTVPPPNVPGYTREDDETYNATNLSPRPRDWRADYSPKQGISSYLPKIGKVRSDVEEYIDTVKRTIHPLLQYTPDTSPLAFDLRYKIVEGRTLLFQNLGRNYNEMDLAQLAAYPPAPMLRLYHPRFPWYVDIHQSHPSGVTVFDVIVQLSLQMQTSIRNRHYYNETLDAVDRAALGKRYKERTKGRPAEGRRGVLQVDFLGEKFVLEGLVRGRQGMWEIKTRRPDR